MRKVEGYFVISHNENSVFNELCKEIVGKGYEPRGKLRILHIPNSAYIYLFQDFIKYALPIKPVSNKRLIRPEKEGEQ